MDAPPFQFTFVTEVLCTSVDPVDPVDPVEFQFTFVIEVLCTPGAF